VDLSENSFEVDKLFELVSEAEGVSFGQFGSSEFPYCTDMIVACLHAYKNPYREGRVQELGPEASLDKRIAEMDSIVEYEEANKYLEV
jgi:hypothetical protein